MSELDDLLKTDDLEIENSSKLAGFLEEHSTKDPSKIGKLQSEITGTIHTKQVATLIQGKVIQNGDKKQKVIGLYRFASATAIIESNVKKDDPFADFMFYNIHEEVILARAELKEKVAYFKNWIKDSIPKALSFTESLNIKPLIIDFKFHSALAFQMTYLILELDEYFRLVKLAQHIALVDGVQANALINDNMRNVRRIMNTVFLYKNSNVTRNDAAANNQIWRRACELMPALVVPEEFLSGEKRSELAPHIPSRPELLKEEDSTIPSNLEVA